MKSKSTLALVVAAGLLAACSGGTMGTNSGLGTSALPVAGASSSGAVKKAASVNTSDAAVLSDISALGGAVKNYEDTLPDPTTTAARHSHAANGGCDNGFEFWSPDLAGTPNSTESQFFYDAACTQLARDVVRVFTLGYPATSETVQRTAKDYAFNNATKISTHTTTQNYSNGSFDPYGFPIFTNGYDLESTSEVSIGTVKKSLSNLEVVMEATKGGSVNNYCSDAAGYNVKGIPGLNKASGYQDGDFSGAATVTVNPGGTVTWAGTRTGTVFGGPVGSLSIATGAFNTACPIATPAYTLAGGNFVGNYTYPITATYSHGLLVNLEITNGARADGNTLNVTTNTALPPTNPFFINGVITNPYDAQVATFAINALGNGTVTVTGDGDQYVMTNWVVIGSK